MNREKRDIRLVFMIFTLFFLLLARRWYPSRFSYILVAFSAVILVLLVVQPLVLKPLFLRWQKIAHAIGRANTQILLFLVFTFIFIPTAFLLRLAGRDLLQRKKPDKTSYWEPYETAGLNDRNRYERQF